MGKKRRAWVWVIGILLVLGLLRLAMPPWPSRTVEMTVSYETTRILGPVKADGTVNYVAYLNAESSEGVTADNNAAIPLLQALGPGNGGILSNAPGPAEMLALLGADMPKDGWFRDYVLVGLVSPEERSAASTIPSTNSTSRLDTELRLSKASAAPWTARTHPELAGWIEANAKALALVVAASRRSRYYLPLVSAEDPRERFSLGPVARSACLSLPRALSIRAMRRIGEGDMDGAWEDILALHRLGRLFSQQPSVVERLTAIATALRANSATKVLLDQIDGKLARRVREDIRDLAPMRDVAEAFDRHDRFTALECVMMLHRGERIDEHLSLKKAQILESDWDQMLRELNGRYDMMVMGLKEPTFAERLAALREFTENVEKARPSRMLVLEILSRQIVGLPLRPAVTKFMTGAIVYMIVPEGSRSAILYERWAEDKELLDVALALTECVRETKEYPETLAALVPKYLPAVPKDRFDEKPIRYRREGSGYVLYSVGENAVDNGGRSEGKGEDDIVISVPLPAKEGERKGP